MSRLELAKIPALTFYKDGWTQAKRTEPIPQLICRGSACKLYQPEVVRCVNDGGNGVDVDWKCSADLPEALRFGKVEVSCEGWSKPGDPYVLKGSCSLEYRLVQIPSSLRNGKSSSNGVQWGNVLFYGVWLVFVVFILYNMISSCSRRNNSTRRSTTTGSRPSGGGGGGGGGWFPGDHRDNNPGPPPPYTKNPPGNPTDQGWRPGFWTGAAAGGLANQFWNNRRQAEPRPYWNQWNQIPVQGVPVESSSMFGGSGSGLTNRRPAPRFDEDRGEGSSNLGNTRRSTGFGGSNVR